MANGCPKCGFEPSVPIERAWAFYIPHPVPTQNKITKVNAFSYKRERDIWHKFLLAAKMSVRIPDAMRKRRVSFFRAMGYRQSAFDRSNFVGGCKPIVDAMVRVHLLREDTQADVEDYYPGQHRASEMSQAQWDELVGLPVAWPFGYDTRTGGLICALEDFAIVADG